MKGDKEHDQQLQQLMQDPNFTTAGKIRSDQIRSDQLTSSPVGCLTHSKQYVCHNIQQCRENRPIFSSCEQSELVLMVHGQLACQLDEAHQSLVWVSCEGSAGLKHHLYVCITLTCDRGIDRLAGSCMTAAPVRAR
jgi:hypothetical protein